MNNFTFEWRDYMRINRITMKWIMQLIVWSTVVAYLPNTIWYFIGYPSDVIIAQVLVITVCVPLIVITSIRSYRKQCGYIPFDGCIQMEESCITIKKIAMKKAGYTHIEVRTVAGSDVKNIVLDKAGGNMTIKAAWRVETCRKKKRLVIDRADPYHKRTYRRYGQHKNTGRKDGRVRNIPENKL